MESGVYRFTVAPSASSWVESDKDHKHEGPMAFLDFLVNDRPMRNLLKLPAGIPRRYAEYRPATSDGSTLPITNVGGYDELPFPRETPSIAAHREGLAAIDNLLDDDIGKRALAGLVRQIGMFCGDVLTHTIPEEFLTVARRHGLNLEKGSEAPRNLDGLERLLELPASDEICRQLLNAWNLYIDLLAASAPHWMTDRRTWTSATTNSSTATTSKASRRPANTTAPSSMTKSVTSSLKSSTEAALSWRLVSSLSR